MKQFGIGKAYGRAHCVTEVEAQAIRAKNKRLVDDKKKAKHDRALILADHRQAKALGMSYEEYIKTIGVN